uniref:Cation efflux protein cytoplasmic domain-containing protein n=1 Tax=Arcella intermedia TaxID=1963864 RepID=A0A6B2L502_9EUKA
MRLQRSKALCHSSHSHPPYDPRDGREGREVTWKGIYANLTLGTGKAMAGILGNSTAMLADSVHTFCDLATDFVTLWTHGMARKGWSVEHPYGFGKFETIGATIVSVVLIMSGVGIATHSLESIVSVEHTTPGQIALVAALVSIVVKEILFRITMVIAKKERSEVLVANAWHHRSDAVSSVVAFIGVGGSILGWPLLDPVAGVIVAGFIIHSGYQILLNSIKELTDNQAIEHDTIEGISNLLKSMPEVWGHHNLRSRKMGPYSLVDFHITVDPVLTVTAGHQIAEKARKTILEKFPQVREALIHVEGGAVSSDPGYHEDHKILPSHSTVVLDIKKELKAFPHIRDSDFYSIHYLGEEVHASFAIILDSATSVKEAKEIGIEAKKVVLQQIPYLTDVVIKLDPSNEKIKTH